MLQVIAQNLALNAIRYAGDGSTFTFTCRETYRAYVIVAEDDAVLLTPAYTYLINNFRSRYQFCLEINSLGWFERVYQPRTIPLRGCQPRDLIMQALALAQYRGEPRALTPELLEAACDSYFVDADEGVSRRP